MRGQRGGEQVWRASPRPGLLRQGHQPYRQAVLGSLTAAEPLAGESMREKEASAENLDALVLTAGLSPLGNEEHWL